MASIDQLPSAPGGAAPRIASPPAADPRELPLEVHDLTVAYHRKPVLWGIDLKARSSASSAPTAPANRR
jgi:hypothetical protein